jgi:hypothetical protein
MTSVVVPFILDKKETGPMDEFIIIREKKKQTNNNNNKEKKRNYVHCLLVKK